MQHLKTKEMIKLATALLFFVSGHAHRIEPNRVPLEDVEFPIPEDWTSELAQINNILIGNPIRFRPNPRKDRSGNKPKREEATIPIHAWQHREPLRNASDEEENNDIKLPAYAEESFQTECHGNECLLNPSDDEWGLFKKKNGKRIFNEEVDDSKEEDPKKPIDGPEKDPLEQLRDVLRKRIKEALEELEKSLDRTRGHQLREPRVGATDRSVPRDDRPIHAWSSPEQKKQFQRQIRQVDRNIFLLKKDRETGRLLEVNQINLNLDVDVHQKQGQGEKQAIVNARKDHNSYGNGSSEHDDEGDEDNDDSDSDGDNGKLAKKDHYSNWKPKSDSLINMNAIPKEKPNFRKMTSRRVPPQVDLDGTDPDFLPERPDAPRTGPQPRDPKHTNSMWDSFVKYVKDTWHSIKRYFSRESITDISTLLAVVVFVVGAQVMILIKVFRPNEEYHLLPDDDEDGDRDENDLEKMGDKRRKLYLTKVDDRSIADEKY